VKAIPRALPVQFKFKYWIGNGKEPDEWDICTRGKPAPIFGQKGNLAFQFGTCKKLTEEQMDEFFDLARSAGLLVGWKKKVLEDRWIWSWTGTGMPALDYINLCVVRMAYDDSTLVEWWIENAKDLDFFETWGSTISLCCNVGNGHQPYYDGTWNEYNKHNYHRVREIVKNGGERRGGRFGSEDELRRMTQTSTPIDEIIKKHGFNKKEEI